VLEAFAAGVPVIGSALGGLTDKIRDGIDGVLVTPFDSVDAWGAVLDRLARAPGSVRELAAGITPPRSMLDVARDMTAVYHALSAGHAGWQAGQQQAHEVEA